MAVVDFDVDVGQVCSAVHPPEALSEDERTKIAYLALPDSNTSTLADVVYCFRLRSDAVPLFASSALGHRYSYGCAYFRQQRDPSSRRGFRQKSVVVVSDTPYVGLLKQVASTLGPLYFQTAQAMENGAPALHVLEAAFAEIGRWPRPVPGVQLYLPLLGSHLEFSVPWVGLHSYRLAALTGQGTAAATAPNSARQPAEADGGNTRFTSINGGGSGDGEASGSAGGAVAAIAAEVATRTQDGASAPSAPLDVPEAAAVGAADAEGAYTTARLAARRASAPAVPHLQLNGSGVAHAGAAAVRSLALGGGDDDADGSAGLTPEAAALRAQPPLTMNEVFAAKSLELPGLFQELGLFSVFRGLVPSLWHLWELAITGE
jgi:hypothetical protein